MHAHGSVQRRDAVHSSHQWSQTNASLMSNPLDNLTLPGNLVRKHGMSHIMDFSIQNPLSGPSLSYNVSIKNVN